PDSLPLRGRRDRLGRGDLQGWGAVEVLRQGVDQAGRAVAPARRSPLRQVPAARSTRGMVRRPGADGDRADGPPRPVGRDPARALAGAGPSRAPRAPSRRRGGPPHPVRALSRGRSLDVGPGVPGSPRPVGMKSIGLVGVPYSGKSTLFTALTRSGAAGGRANQAVVPVPDDRLGVLASLE